MGKNPREDDFYNYRSNFWETYGKKIPNWNRRFRTDSGPESKEEFITPSFNKGNKEASIIPDTPAGRLFGRWEGGMAGRRDLGLAEAVTRYPTLKGEVQEGYLDGFSDAAARISLGLPTKGNVAPEHTPVFTVQKNAVKQLVIDTIARREQLRQQPK